MWIYVGSDEIIFSVASISLVPASKLNFLLLANRKFDPCYVPVFWCYIYTLTVRRITAVLMNLRGNRSVTVEMLTTTQEIFCLVP
jgi:hypothetical protein